MRRGPPNGRARLRRWGVAVLCTLLFSLLYLIAVRTTWGQRLDDAAFEARKTQWLSLRQGIARVIVYGAPVLVVAAAMVAAVLAARTSSIRRTARGGSPTDHVAGSRPKGWYPNGWHLVLAVAGAALTAEVAKVILCRPALLSFTWSSGRNSFPSAHATTLTAITLSASAVALVTPTQAATAISVGGIALLHTGWHRPSDVIAGQLLALVWCLLPEGTTAAGTPGANRAATTSRLHPATPTKRALLGAGVVALLGVSATVGRSIGTDTTHPITPFVLSECAVAASSWATVATYRRTRTLRSTGLTPTGTPQRPAAPRKPSAPDPWRPERR